MMQPLNIIAFDNDGNRLLTLTVNDALLAFDFQDGLRGTLLPAVEVEDGFGRMNRVSADVMPPGMLLEEMRTVLDRAERIEAT